MATKLLPCPFCGAEYLTTENEKHGSEKVYFVLCQTCAAEGGWGHTIVRAVRWWNTRLGNYISTNPANDQNVAELLPGAQSDDAAPDNSIKNQPSQAGP